MATPEFPYRPLLKDLTATVNEQGLDPYEAYYSLYHLQRKHKLNPDAYLSSSITSGGHAHDESLQMAEIIQRNTQSAYLLADQLAADRQINPISSIEPVAVGKTHWNQVQFMEFWLSVIGGMQFRPGATVSSIDHLRNQAYGLFEKHGVDLERMVSKASPEVRAADYFNMSAAFAELVTPGTVEANPIEKVVRMIDPDKSLGAQAERVFAREIGSKVMNICVMEQASPSALNKVNQRPPRTLPA